MKKLTGKARKERELHLREWLKNKDSLLRDWVQSLPSSYAVFLDYSIASLIPLGEYIISRYKTSGDVEDLSNQSEFNLISGYIGEVYIKNMPGNNYWSINDMPLRVKGVFEFNLLVGNDNIHAFDPFDTCVPSLVYYQERNKIHSIFKVKIDYLQNKLSNRKSINTVPGKGGFSYQYFILIKDESFKLNEIKGALKAHYTKKGKEDDVHFYNERHLLVNMGDDYYFHFQLDTSEGVLQESKEISENYKGDKDKSVITSCSSRVEFWGDEDSDGDYINDHMFILEQLMNNEKLMIFDFRNGVFFDEF
ncbi:MAG: hypothetical protein OCD76_23985 [Reichenbachiella sp.]